MREPEDRLSASREELRAAAYLLAGGFSPQALSRSYYAVFYAASAAVQLRSEHPRTHPGLIARFAKLVVVEGGFDPDVGATLRELFGDRIVVDYETLDMGSEEARRALERAERFVDAVEAWIAAQPSGEGS